VLKRGEIFKELPGLEQGPRGSRAASGLGLSIVERLARVLNHGIALDSNVSGGGFCPVTVPPAERPSISTRTVTGATPLFPGTPMNGLPDVCYRERRRELWTHEKPLLKAWDARYRGYRSDAAIRSDQSAGGRGHPVSGTITSPWQRRRRDPGPSPAGSGNIPAILITPFRVSHVRGAEAAGGEHRVLNKPGQTCISSAGPPGSRAHHSKFGGPDVR